MLRTTTHIGVTEVEDTRSGVVTLKIPAAGTEVTIADDTVRLATPKLNKVVSFGNDYDKARTVGWALVNAICQRKDIKFVPRTNN